MIIVCVDCVDRHNYLTYGKSYKVYPLTNFSYDKKSYRVLCDDGGIRWELKWRFVTLEDWRQSKLEELC